MTEVARVFFFFSSRRRHTRCSRDWSSDVCSSDLDQDRQLVFTAPTPPNTLVGLEERIASRLEGGLVAELTEPDRDVKRTVLVRLLTLQGINAEPALIDYLADRHADSVRGLVAGVQRVVSAAAAQDAPVRDR